MIRRILQIQAAAIVAILLTGCALLSQSQLDAAKTGMGYGLTIYGSGYQPILALYAQHCEATAWAAKPCDRALYKKLYELDGAVAQCSQAAVATLRENSPDFALVTECVKQAEAAKLAFANSGIKLP